MNDACTSGIHQLLIQLFSIQFVFCVFCFAFCFGFTRLCEKTIEKWIRMLKSKHCSIARYHSAIKCTTVNPCVPAFLMFLQPLHRHYPLKKNCYINCLLCVWMHLSANCFFSFSSSSTSLTRIFPHHQMSVHIAHIHTFAWFIRKLNSIHSFAIFPFIRALSHWTWNIIIIIQKFKMSDISHFLIGYRADGWCIHCIPSFCSRNSFLVSRAKYPNSQQSQQYILIRSPWYAHHAPYSFCAVSTRIIIIYVLFKIRSLPFEENAN